eukprot:m.96740 g.96740  ORF g.96740 m.96740 type:complete len:244 (+) comp8972_c0_seq7:1074-1805(+)
MSVEEVASDMMSELVIDNIHDADDADDDDFFGDQSVDDLVVGEKDSLAKEREHKKNAYVEAVNAQHSVALQEGYEEGLAFGVKKGKPFGELMGKVCTLLMFLTNSENENESQSEDLINELQKMYEALYILDENSFSDMIVEEQVQETDSTTVDKATIPVSKERVTNKTSLGDEADTVSSCCDNGECDCGENSSKSNIPQPAESGNIEESGILPLDYETMLISCQQRVALLEKIVWEVINDVLG